MNKLLIDAAHSEETRIAVVSDKGRLEEFEFESASKRPLKGNIYLAKVVRVEPALQAAFVEYHDGRNGFLPFGEIHTDYYQLPVADKKELQKILDEIEAQKNRDNEDDLLPDESIDEDALYVDDDNNDDDDGVVVGEPDNVINIEFNKDDSDDGDNVEFSSEMLIDAAQKDGQYVVIEDEDGQEIVDAGDIIEVEVSGGEDGEKEVLEQVIEEEKNQIKSKFDFFKKYKIQEVIKKNQVLLIQVVKEERGNKGAALTTFLSLAGRYSVLMPNTRSSGGVSRKITNQKDRKRLKKALQSLDIPENMSLIVRTAGQHKTKMEIKRDYEYLSKLWEEIRSKTLSSNAPCVINEEANIIKRAIRDIYDKDMDEILVEGKDGYKMAKDFMKKLMPSHAKKVKQYKPESGISVFHKHSIDHQIIELQEQEVSLPSGGSLVINLTEALVAVDVNSGRAIKGHSVEETAYKTNIEAAVEVARQMRLRDLAGLVVVDFIDMEDGSHIQAVERKMREHVRTDRARIQLGSISQFGLFELSRQRLKSSYFETIFSPCKRCGGTGFVKSTEAVALNIIREIQDVVMDKRKFSKSGKVSVTLSNEAALYLFNNKRHQLRDIEGNFDVEIIFASDPNADINFYKIVMLDLVGNHSSNKKQERTSGGNKNRKPQTRGKRDNKNPSFNSDKNKPRKPRNKKNLNSNMDKNKEDNTNKQKVEVAEKVNANQKLDQKDDNAKRKHNPKFNKRNKRRNNVHNRDDKPSEANKVVDGANKQPKDSAQKSGEKQKTNSSESVKPLSKDKPQDKPKNKPKDNLKGQEKVTETTEPKKKKRGWWQNLLKSDQ